jgi:hypothetical protein
MDAIFCIVLSTLVLRSWWKSHKPLNRAENYQEAKTQPQTISSFKKESDKTPEDIEAEKLQKEIEKRKNKDIADLKRQGYTDELISVILPTINNDGR